MKLKLGDSSIIQCGNTDVTKCHYSQMASDLMPVVESVSLKDSATISFVGKNFFTSGYVAAA